MISRMFSFMHVIFGVLQYLVRMDYIRDTFYPIWSPFKSLDRIHIRGFVLTIFNNISFEAALILWQSLYCYFFYGFILSTNFIYVTY